MKIAVTGHRPNKLKNVDAIQHHMMDFLLVQDPAPVLISGGALGVDQLWIEVGLCLELLIIAALPFKDYDNKWSAALRQKYQRLLDQCHEVRYICEPGYQAHKFQKRNEWMVDNCDLLVAYWNGTPSGTKNCIDYALKVKRNVQIFNPDDIIDI